jgi:hypothetical protein
MKSIKFVALLVLLLGTFSCKKSVDIAQSQPVDKMWWRVLLVGEDTTTLQSMYAREYAGPTSDYPHASVDSDAYLSASLLGYSNGRYLVQVTNKQNCTVGIQWHFDGVTITAITPNPLNSLLNNQLAPNSTQLFYLTGDKKLGKIDVQATTTCTPIGSFNPKWLMLDITAMVLPVSAAAYTAKTIDDKTTEISFDVKDPSTVDWVIVQNLKDGVWKQALLLGCDHITQHYSFKLNR